MKRLRSFFYTRSEKMDFAWVIVWVLIAVFCIVASFNQPEAVGSTWIVSDDTLTLSAVDATPLDGTSANRTFMPTDRLSTYSVRIDERTDYVEVYFYSTGGDTAGDTALINIYGYGKDGPAMRIYDAATVTLGTAVAPDSGLYADGIAGTDKHVTAVSVKDESADTVAKMTIQTHGIQWLYFEPETFTGITSIIVKIRSYGVKQSGP